MSAALSTPNRAHAHRVPPAPKTWKSALVVTFSFRCNVACTFCMVEDVLGAYEGVTLARFEELVRTRSPALASFESIYFGGGEVTLSRDLPAYVALAKTLPNVKNVRVQTNALRLDDPAYLDQLISAGVDEFFVSMHGHDAATCEAITQRRGSFDRITAGMQNISRSDARLITNTVIVKENYQHLSEIVRTVAPFKPAWVEFWNYWPRVHEQNTERFIVPVRELRPFVHDAAREALAGGTAPVVKWFPRCLMGEYVDYHDDGQPEMLIEEQFWDREPAYSCLYEGVCASGRSSCSGLSDAYVSLFGYEQDLLVPERSSTPPRQVDDAMFRSLLKDAVPRRAEMAIVAAWLAQFGLAFGASIGPFVLHSFARSRDRLEAQLVLAHEGGDITLRIRPRDPTRASHRHTPSFDIIAVSRDPARAAVVSHAVALVAQKISAADPGSLSLPR